jgi:hypothetical protein
MTPSYYHNPPPPVSTRVLCPVCHKPVYSRGDIHPQCAVRQADQTEQVELKKGRANGILGAPDIRCR